MEKYRKFDDARNGVNPFVPAKVVRGSAVATFFKGVSRVFGIQSLWITMSVSSEC